MQQKSNPTNVLKSTSRTINEKFELDTYQRKLERENQILAQKLKVLKHQLINYTKAESSYAKSSSRIIMPVAKARKSTENLTLNSELAKTDSFQRIQSKRKKAIHNDKADESDENIQHKSAKNSLHIDSTEDIVRIHVHNQELQNELDELRFRLKSNEKKLTILADEYDRLVSELDVSRKSLRDAEHRLAEAQSRDVAQEGTESAAQRDLCIASMELKLLKEENCVLKSSHERLISSSMEHDLIAKTSAEELSRLKSHIESLEYRIGEERDRRKRGDAQIVMLKADLAKWRQKAKNTEAKDPVVGINGINKNNNEEKRSDNEDSEDGRYYHSLNHYRLNSSKESNKRSSKATENIFERLFSDVIGIVNAHIEVDRTDENRLIDTVINATGDDGVGQKKQRALQKWQKMYEEIYVELEKVRNLLLDQYNINECLKKELTELRAAGACEARRYETLCDEKAHAIEQCDRQIQVLKNQLCSLASGCRPLNSIQEALTNDSISQTKVLENPLIGTRSDAELTLRFTKLALTADALKYAKSLTPLMFLSMEFFDFELETTPLLRGPETIFDYSTIYDLIISNLLIHYLETDGICVELFEVQGASYELRGSATITLKELLLPGASEKSKVTRHLSGQLKFYRTPEAHIQNQKQSQAQIQDQTLAGSQEKEILLAVLDYHIDAPFNLLKLLNAQRRKITASLYLPIDGETRDDYNELCVEIHRCRGVGSLCKGHQEIAIYVAYEIFDLPVHLSKVHRIQNAKQDDVQLNDVYAWRLPTYSDSFHRYLKSQELLIYVFEDVNDVAGIATSDASHTELGHVNLPLFPLAKNMNIRGSFPIVDSNGELLTETCLDISLYWRFAYIQPHDFEDAVEIKKSEIEANKILNYTKFPTNLYKTENECNVESNISREECAVEAIDQRSKNSKGENEDHKNEKNDNIIKSTSQIVNNKIRDSSDKKYDPNFDNQILEVIKGEKSEKPSGLMVQEKSEKEDKVHEIANDLATSGKWSSSSSLASDATYSAARRSPTDEDIILDGSFEKNDEKNLRTKIKTNSTKINIEEKAKIFNAEFETTEPKKELKNDNNKKGEESIETDPFEPDLQASSTGLVSSSSTDSSIAPVAILSQDEDYENHTDIKLPVLPAQLSLATAQHVRVDETQRGENTKVHFNEPLHHSIPPSETSSFAETLSESGSKSGSPGAGVKPPVAKPRTRLKVQQHAANALIAGAVTPQSLLRTRAIPNEQEDFSGIEVETHDAVVRVRVGRMRLIDASPLLRAHFDEARVFIEWNFLDFARELCETHGSRTLPRNTRDFIDFSEDERAYELKQQQIALLRQWTNTNNRLMFTMVLDSGDDDTLDFDDLCVGELPLADVLLNTRHFITMRDVDGIAFASIEVEIQYSDKLRSYLSKNFH